MRNFNKITQDKKANTCSATSTLKIVDDKPCPDSTKDLTSPRKKCEKDTQTDGIQQNCENTSWTTSKTKCVSDKVIETSNKSKDTIKKFDNDNVYSRVKDKCVVNLVDPPIKDKHLLYRVKSQIKDKHMVKCWDSQEEKVKRLDSQVKVKNEEKMNRSDSQVKVNKEDKLKLAELHVHKMPYITCSNSRIGLVAWTDVKEILFPSCSHPKCDIVVNALKLKLRYPWAKDAMRACTPKEHVTFLRMYRIVPSGILLVNIEFLKTNFLDLSEMIRIKHQKSDNEYSRLCHYAEAQPSEDCCRATTDKTGNLRSSNEKRVLSCIKQIKQTLTTNASQVSTPDILYDSDNQETLELESTNLEEGKVKLLSNAKTVNDVKQCVYNKNDNTSVIIETIKMNKVSLPALNVKTNGEIGIDDLYVPAYLINLCFPSLVNDLIQICTDHLVRSSDNKTTHCCSVSEGRAFTRWMCKNYGWSQNWRHLTSRDILIRKTDIESYLSTSKSDKVYMFNKEREDATRKTSDVAGSNSDIRLQSGKDTDKTPQNNARQPKKRQRIKSPTEPLPDTNKAKDDEPVVIEPNIEQLDLLKENGILTVQNVNNSALTGNTSSLDSKFSKRGQFSANLEKSKPDSRITQLEVKAFGKLSRPETSPIRIKSKMLNLEDKLKAQWDINRTKMKLLEERILKKLEESRISREISTTSANFNFKRVYGSSESQGDSQAVKCKVHNEVKEKQPSSTDQPSTIDSKETRENVKNNVECTTQSCITPVISNLATYPPVITQRLPTHPAVVATVPSQSQTVFICNSANFNNRPMFIPQFYQYRPIVPHAPGNVAPVNYNNMHHRPGYGSLPTQENIIFTHSLPNQSQSSYSSTNKNRLQNFYPSVDKHVVFQPVGNWPRQSQKGGLAQSKFPLKYIPDSKDQTCKNERETLMKHEGENAFLHPNFSDGIPPNAKLISVNEVKTAGDSNIDQVVRSTTKSTINYSDQEKKSSKNKSNIEEQLNLQNDLVGSIVKESIKSMANLSFTTSQKQVAKGKTSMSTKTETKSAGRTHKLTLPKSKVEKEANDIKSQSEETDNELLTLVSANPFTQSLESLKAMKDVMNNKTEIKTDVHSSCKANKGTVSGSSKSKCAPIQRVYGCLGTTTTDNTETPDCENSDLVPELVSSNSFSDRLNGNSETNNPSNVDQDCGENNKEKWKSDNHAKESKTTDKIRNRRICRTNEEFLDFVKLNKENVYSVYGDDAKLPSSWGRVNIPWISKSQGCIPKALLEDETKQHTPARESSSAPSLPRRRSLLGSLNKDFGSYESVRGEDLKMTFYRIRDPENIRDIDSENSRNAEIFNDDNENISKIMQTKDTKENSRKHRKSASKHYDNSGQVDVHDMENILAAMQRSYEKHENTKIRQSLFSSADSFRSAEKVYKAKQMSKSGLGYKSNRLTSAGKTKSSGYKKNSVKCTDKEAKYKPEMTVKSTDHVEKPIIQEKIINLSNEKGNETGSSLKGKANETISSISSKTLLEIPSSNNVDIREVPCEGELDTGMKCKISHPKKRWMKEFMVCCPTEIERMASMDLLALGETSEDGSIIKDKWDKDLSDFVQHNITSSKTRDVDEKLKISPPVLKISNLPTDDDDSSGVSPPMPHLEMIEDCDLTVDHEEEVAIESESYHKLVHSSLDNYEYTNKQNMQVNSEDTETLTNHPDVNICVDNVNSDLEGSLFVIDDTEDLEELKVLRRSARQSLSPAKHTLSHVKSDLDRIYGSKIQIRKLSSRGRRKKSAKAKQRKTPEKKPDFVKRNKTLIRNSGTDHSEINDSMTQSCNTVNSWQNFVKEQNIMMDIIKRVTPTKKPTRASAKSIQSEESVDRTLSVPPCNTPCSLSDENVFGRDPTKFPLNEGNGDGYIGTTQSFQRDRDDFTEFCVKLKPTDYHKENLLQVQFHNDTASGDVDKFCESLNLTKEPFMKPDEYGFLYEPIRHQYGLSKGGLIYQDKIVMPYVMVNGYKYVAVQDLLQLFTECVPKCLIPRTTLHKYKGLFRSYCNWEQVYVLDLLYVKRGRSLKTGDMLLRFDTFLTTFTDLKAAIKEKHRSTTYKRSQDCDYVFD